MCRQNQGREGMMEDGMDDGRTRKPAVRMLMPDDGLLM
jgi:hypothetical protein